MPLQSISQGPFIKGVIASTQPLAQPKGSISRVSNMILTSRGSLTPCDGTGIINAFNGAVQVGLGKMLAETLFDPTGVSPYYLALVQSDVALGPPNHLTLADGGAGGTLAAGTYFYKVTAIDGAGGETTASNEASITIAANHKIILTWNIAPNAFGYNVYRSDTSGAETILTGVNLPVLQPSPLALTVGFTDDGSDVAGKILSVLTSAIILRTRVGSINFYTVSFNLAPQAPPATFPTIGAVLTYIPGTNATWALPWTVTGFSGPNQMVCQHTGPQTLVGADTTGGTFALSNTPPVVDTTAQTALVQMPPGAIPVPYTDANIVALFPASLNALNSPPSGGSGGFGTNGIGRLGNQSSTPNGGIPGMVSLLPQFQQFTNRMVIALGNGFRPQLFSDATGTPTNPAFSGVIDAGDITVDAFGVVSIITDTDHGLDPAQALGTNVLVSGVTPSVYNGVFIVIDIPATNEVRVRNLAAIGAGASSVAGTMTVTTVPLVSTFTPGDPEWISSATLSVGDVIVPATQPSAAIYLTVIQGGETGTVEPSWPTGGIADIGQHVPDNTVIYSVAGLLNSAAPAPPGASHLAVFSSALFVLNTSPSNTADGLDGPCSLRQSSINNPNSWNPVNQAFLDKDDGSEGMSLAKFTITAQGIPPQGSLIAFKNYSPYQIIGVFGAANLQIQAVSSDMGCISPRTTIFVPGFGIMRYSHLGVAVFNGVKDEVVSEQIRPYLFPTNNRNVRDIIVVDANWTPVSWAALTANPPQFSLAMPIGDSNGQLTRVFCYDLVMKAWMVADLPFSISSMAQVRSEVSNPITIFGGYSDGVLQRWQAGDIDWYTGGGDSEHGVDWRFRTLTVASSDTDQRVYVRRLVVTGSNSGPRGNISVTVRMAGVEQGEQEFSVAPDADFDIDVAVQLTGKRFDAEVYSGIGPPPTPVNTPPPLQVEIDGVTWQTEPRPSGVVVGV